MSQPSRKGSLGVNPRRGPQKAHIPYRGDDLEHGKKTGKIINQVSRDADDFEPFEQVLDQAYRGGSAPRSTNNRSKAVNGHSYYGRSPALEEFDDSGERSMDIESTQNSPSVYFNNTTAPPPTSTKRVGSSSQQLTRSSVVDYDTVPSPKPIWRRTPVLYGPNSRVRQSSSLRKEVQDDEGIARGRSASPNNDISAPLGAGDEGVYLDHDMGGNDNLSPNSRSNISFTALAQDDEDDMSPQDDQSPSSTRTDKGKGRAQIQDSGEEDAGIEEDAAVDLQLVDDTDNEERERSPSRKRLGKGRGGSVSDFEPPSKRNKQSGQLHPKRTKKQPRISVSETLDHNGLRRSKRRHYPPLEYWRQEKVVWGRRENGPAVVPVIKEIITIPKPSPVRLGTKRKRGVTRATRSKPTKSPVEEIHVIEVDNPELGWDDNTSCNGIILDWYSKREVERRVAYTAKMITPKPAQANKYSFQKVFGDGNFIAAGQLVIPAGEEKPTKPAKDNTYVFYVIEGAIECKVHRSSFVLATGGMFMVPRGNQYYIRNICERDVKIFFAQARKIGENDMDVMPEVLSRSSAPPRPHSSPHLLSHGAFSPK